MRIITKKAISRRTMLRAAGVDFLPHLYEYLDRGGTRHAASSLNVPEHEVVKTLVMEDESGAPLLVTDQRVHLVHPHRVPEAMQVTVLERHRGAAAHEQPAGALRVAHERAQPVDDRVLERGPTRGRAPRRHVLVESRRQQVAQDARDFFDGKPKAPGILVGMDQKDSYVGKEAKAKKNLLIIEEPVQRGIVVNFDHIEKIFEHCSSTCRKEPEFAFNSLAPDCRDRVAAARQREGHLGPARAALEARPGAEALAQLPARDRPA